MTRRRIRFLTLAEVVEIHRDQIGCHGGQTGIRDIALLASALAMPLSTFASRYLHEDIFHMAAAYAYHICRDHPFLDGNKQTGLVAALVFLDFNGCEIDDPKEVLYDAMMDIASGEMTKGDLAHIFRQLAAESSR